jgi:hypothetical protein
MSDAPGPGTELARQVDGDAPPPREPLLEVAGGEMSRTVNLDLGNMAEVNMIAINASYIVSVRLTGSLSSASRKMELTLTSGTTIGMNFDDPDHAEIVFGQVVSTINRTIPDYAG